MENYNENQQGDLSNDIGNSLNDVAGIAKGISDIDRGLNYINDVGKETTKDMAKETGKEAAKEAVNETAKEAGKEAANGAAKAAATDAAAASTGVGIPLVIADISKRGLDSLMNSDKKNSGSGIAAIIGIIVFVLYLMVSIAGIHGNVAASSEKYQEDQYIQYEEDKGLLSRLKSNIKKFFSLFGEGEETDEMPGEYSPYEPLKESLDKTIPILEKAFSKAYEFAEKECEAIIIKENYDYTLTMNSFKNNPYPFENINYAEILSITSQKNEYNIENTKFKNFKKLFKASFSNNKIKYLYCMKVEEAFANVRFYAKNDMEIRLSEGESPPAPEEGEEEYEVFTKQIRYGKVTLKHYDLKSLYEMLELEPNEKNEHWDINNIDMLNTQELYFRFYAREYDLGPSERTVWSWGFGRGNELVSEDEYLEFSQYLELYGGDVSEAIKKMLEAAFAKLGTTYSQENRTLEGYFDCSSFVAYCYRQIGIEFGAYAPTAAGICRYLENTGHQIGNSYNDSLQPGDIIFYSSQPNGRYKNITHVALYVGNGKIIDASSSKGEVVYRDIWGKNQIVSVCRPLK